MNADRLSLIQQLARILARLESDFGARVDEADVASVELATKRIDLAADCIASARRVLAAAPTTLAPDAAPPPHR